MIKRAVLLFLFLIVISSAVFAANEITQLADRLNFWTDETHVVTVFNNGIDAVQVNISIPTGFAYSAGCSNPAAGIISCEVGPSSSTTYTVTSTAASFSEYGLGLFELLATNNTYTGNNVSFIKIQDDEIFHTLVEYGRGRGNYFFDTYGTGLAGSGHTGTGCSYVPNGTMFELNFLHKINNVKHYFGDLSAVAYNATFSCTYPNDTIVRQHLTTSIFTDSSGASVTYLIPSIGGSWERMGYLGMNFDADSYAVGGSISVSCANMSYLLPVGGGYLVVDSDAFTLQVRNREPFTASASTATTIGNGTQEVLIIYTITNNELYTADDVVIEINAPPYATFIGTRGELWGTALDQYRIEKAQLLAGESEVVQLVARFDTSNAPSMASVALTNGIKVEYTTCWELNAYNPGEYVQTLTNIGSATVDMGVPTEIVGIFDRLDLIYNLTVIINETVLDINDTVTNIQYIVEIINTTTQDTNVLVKAINSTSYEILNKTEYLLNNTILILNDTQFISDQLNCNGTDDSPICDKVTVLNNSLYHLWNISLMLNYTAHNLNITVLENINTSGLNITVNVDLSNITDALYYLKTFINCTNTSFDSSLCNRVARIENNTIFINSTLNTLLNVTTYFNTSVFGNLTFQQILDAISNITVDTSDVLTALQESRAFSEEIVFLITDSFGLQQQAGREFAGGDVGSALTSLNKANNKLTQVADQLAVERENEAVGELSSFSTSWVWVAFIFILIAGVVVFYLFGRVPPSDRKGRISFGPLKILMVCLLLLLFAALANAQSITQYAEALNFDTYKNLTVNVIYGCTGDRQFNVTVPAGSGFEILTASGACTAGTSVVTCDFDGQQTGTYNISHPNPSSIPYYATYEFPTLLNDSTGCTVANNISVIRIPDDEIFYTLVEYGRGRGNYFYSTQGGTAGSGHTGVGCNYVPNGTMFELNFLHKIFSIKQYFDDSNLLATNATFTCTYPNRTIVRSHQGTSISQSAAGTTITYLISEIEGSWERMGYVGLQFDSNEQNVGDNLTITCRGISYAFGDLGGDISVYESNISFNLEVRNPEPFTASASTTTATIGNGTQEVLITYAIINNESYTVDDVIIEINAPPYATFISTRGELWGSALDQYRIEKISLSPGESEIIQLVARFDTSAAPTATTSLNLTSGIRLKYVTCWDLNAYNPGETVQNIFDIGSATVDMGVPTSIVNIRERLEQIYYLVNYINTTTIAVNNTVNYIESVILMINSTTIETNQIVQTINSTLYNISNNVNLAYNNTENIIIETNLIKDLINCNGTTDSFICSQLDDMNNSVNNITNILLEINNTLNNITINVTIDLTGYNLTVNATPDLTNISLIIDDIFAELNCSMNWTTEPEESLCKTLNRIENNALEINNTIEEINNLIYYFNATVFGNVTLQQIYDALGNTTVDTSSLLSEIKLMREFNEELVFLVTDAFGLQQAAKADLDNGDLGSAAAKLREANAKLSQAAERLTEMQEEEAAAIEGGGELSFTWVLILAGAIVLAALGFFLFSRPKDN